MSAAESSKKSIAGRILAVETGKLAQQANGAAVVRYGDTLVLVTACANRQACRS